MIPNIVLTSAGADLLAKIPAGEAARVTRWQIGKGSLTSGSSLDRTALVDPVKYLPLYQISNAGNTATVLGQFTNQGETEGFDFEELGLLAQDPDGGEILFAYGNAFGDGEAIQPGTEQLREFIFGAELLFSSAPNVTGEISQSLLFIPESEKGAVNGVASLGADGKVPADQMPKMDYEAPLKNSALKETPVDADSLPLVDSADGSKTKRVLWSRTKAVLKAYFDQLYAADSHKHGAGDITSGILGVARGGTGQTTLTPAVDTVALRASYAGTTDLTAGSSALTTGALYFVYE